MNRSIPRQWWIPVLVLSIALIIFSFVRVISDHGSLPALFMILASTCITASQLIKRAAITLWIAALVLVALALIIGIHPI